MGVLDRMSKARIVNKNRLSYRLRALKLIPYYFVMTLFIVALQVCFAFLPFRYTFPVWILIVYFDWKGMRWLSRHFRAIPYLKKSVDLIEQVKEFHDVNQLTTNFKYIPVGVYEELRGYWIEVLISKSEKKHCLIWVEKGLLLNYSQAFRMCVIIETWKSASYKNSGTFLYLDLHEDSEKE
ncbi:hypothetical protein LNP00_05685 [Fructobacillus sp. M158]|uniref:hypothetical protein n=1 Tax=Fructobacillus parabroussonetiae TaxID=2713174 RepID=UPI00200A7A59|nr:hypothetical protein [Fructobacillus parabroussonetiae]MCK8617844.1 hypothetical protein [Fructobacillus parabroussonetiae]